MRPMTIAKGQSYRGDRTLEVLRVDGEGVWGTITGFRLEVLSAESQKKYVLVLRETAGRSACACPAWKFRGAKPGRRGLLPPTGERWPCPHLRTIFANLGDQAPSLATLVVLRGARFAMLPEVDW